MNYDLFRLIEIKTNGYAGVSYKYENMIQKYSDTAKPGELYIVYGVGSNETRQIYEVIESDNGIAFIKTNKKPIGKWIPLHLYTDHNIASSLIWAGEEKDSCDVDFTDEHGNSYNKINFFWTENGRYLKDMIMNDSEISRRGIPKDCNEEYVSYMNDDDTDGFFSRKSYKTYVTLDELEIIKSKLEKEWKADILDKLINQKNDDINNKLDNIIRLLQNKPMLSFENNEDDDDDWYEDEYDMFFNEKYWLIQDIHKEIEGISLLVNGASGSYISNSEIRIIYWVE